MPYLIAIGGVVILVFGLLLAMASRYRRCPSDKILVVYGKVAGGASARCFHGGACFVLPIFQDYEYLDLTPVPIDINLQGALSKQNIRVNTPSTFTVGISTEPGIMENAAERLLGLPMQQVKELAKDIIFGQMRVVIATMDIEEINADRDKLINNISTGVEVELKKVGLRLINVNVQDITDESGYINALGQEAASKAIADAKVKVAEAQRDGEIGSADAQRDQRIRVADANAEATKGENLSKIQIADSNSDRRAKEAEAERTAATAENVAKAKALEDSYVAEEKAERQRADREKATQHANIVVPAEVSKEKAVVDAEAQAESVRRSQLGEADAVRYHKQAEADGLKAVKQAEADGLRFHLTAEADGTKLKLLAEAEGAESLLLKKANGFKEIIKACGDAQGAQSMLVIEQLQDLVKEQANAISGLKIDKVNVWDSGRGANGKGATADFVSGLVGSMPPLHDIAKSVGIDLPEYLGKMAQDEDDENSETNGEKSHEPVGKRPAPPKRIHLSPEGGTDGGEQ